MAVRVRPEPSTKWWILLAAILAALLTWWDHASRPARRRPDLVEIEVVGPDGTETRAAP
jgi:hypothetical protein